MATWMLLLINILLLITMIGWMIGVLALFRSVRTRLDIHQTRLQELERFVINLVLPHDDA